MVGQVLIEALYKAAENLSLPGDARIALLDAADAYARLYRINVDQRRDRFAAAALAGYCANPEFNSSDAPSRAAWCRDDADAMIAELDRSKT